MKQLTQKLKDGKLKVNEVVPPALLSGMVLVQNHFSLISAGTEASTVSTARKSLIGKARERPQQVKQVIDVLTQQGPVQTYRAVMKKLEAHSPLGYSSSGTVLDVAPDVRGFTPGDKVACGGVGYANHAEVVAVPVNLCVKLAPNARLDLAAYNTVAAIAMQGIRQADLRLGESAVVIGMGLIGQLTGLMLRAAGIKVVGVDINGAVLDLAMGRAADLTLVTGEPGLAEQVDEFTRGLGADAVLITAGTSSTEPVNLAGRLSRKKGKVVVVGAVPTGFDRDPFYYRKELELRMSCSYGPGRYDLEYEEKGRDYPAAYVRWTENRNMSAFQELVQNGRMDMDYLTTHSFDLEDAPDAYDLILARDEPYLGVLIRYTADSMPFATRIDAHPAAPPGRINVAFIGAGSYAQSHLLPNVEGADVVKRGVFTASGTNSKSVLERYGFEFCTATESDILESKIIDTVFVATWHNTHADYVGKCVAAGKNVFVEKPLAMDVEQLDAVAEAVASQREAGVEPRVMVGYNRRFSPLTVAAVDHLGKGPMTMLYRVNAGDIPLSSWIQDPDLGGGRIIGEVCHFVDYFMHACGSVPVSVYATASADPEHKEDCVVLNLAFANGSVGTICYLANGPRSLPKEYVELYRAGSAAILRDFREVELFGSGRTSKKKLLGQNKGQKAMVGAWLDAIREGRQSPISFEELFAGTRATLGAIASIRHGQVVRLV
jgi:predicted dehydrogenase/threonine dehydrogenase-like Zn-dependent dehydrogenase